MAVDASLNDGGAYKQNATPKEESHAAKIYPGPKQWRKACHERHVRPSRVPKFCAKKHVAFLKKGGERTLAALFMNGSKGHQDAGGTALI